MKMGLAKLSTKIHRLSNALEYIENLSSGRSVLNVGAAGGVSGYLPANKENWLHERLKNCAGGVLGIDIDEAAINYAKKNGYDINYANCETMNLDKKFDVIILSDVIEHMNAPVIAVENLFHHLNDEGFLVITTPNATAGNIIIRSILNKKINILADHVSVYYPENFQNIAERLNVQIKSFFVFDNIDRRNIRVFIKSIIFKVMTIVSPRLGSSLLIVMQNK
ncbi:bifunctional 2-polyprenyl-6-hydroxyphenol methylase/3-demethylubiquinol 3-O-methyltransferase UbiG [Endozoicomonas sp. YOMI1]|uniref:class I SAM-dependent methyltransferase n=1 Tax=Endozoicomonas sp. YOMI1 TaxID=2828739 RepID=UPI00214880EA|nr:class I SAM-dependent methyltransferase [Endozoicomonas sp. YOMI1]